MRLLAAVGIAVSMPPVFATSRPFGLTDVAGFAGFVFGLSFAGKNWTLAAGGGKSGGDSIAVTQSNTESEPEGL